MTGLNPFLTQSDRLQFFSSAHSNNNSQSFQINRIPFIIYREFSFDSYPLHVEELQSYSFKVLIWAEMMLEHDVFLWIDASGRFKPCFNYQYMVMGALNVSISMHQTALLE